MSTDPNAQIRYVQERATILKKLIKIQLAFRHIFFDEEKCSLKAWVPFDVKMLKICLNALRMEAYFVEMTDNSFLVSKDSDELMYEFDNVDIEFGDGGMDHAYIDHLKILEEIKEKNNEDLRGLKKKKKDENSRPTTYDSSGSPIEKEDFTGRISECKEIRDVLASI